MKIKFRFRRENTRISIYVTVSDDALKARLGGAIRNNYTADFMKAKKHWNARCRDEI